MLPYDDFSLTADQRSICLHPPVDRLFLSGVAGTGKTTTAIHRINFLLNQDIQGKSILLLVPQRTLASRYLDALFSARSGSPATYLTIGGLARRMIDLFWPYIAEQAGFGLPNQPPVFLTLETAQYYIARLVYPLLEQGYFSSISIERNRLLSQVIDNLNKAALVGFPHTQIAQRLKSAWTGDSSQARVYDDAQFCAIQFRNFCLEHNLLDFSLQLELFTNILWKLPQCRGYIQQTYQHLIYDNLEEDTPIAHDILRDWLPDTTSALLIFDEDAGFRRFLGADPTSAKSLSKSCDEVYVFENNFSMGSEIQALQFFRNSHFNKIEKPVTPDFEPSPRKDLIPDALTFHSEKYFPQMLDWVAENVAYLHHELGTPPGEIAILSPFLSDALRFSLSHRLDALGVPNRSHRPSRSLRDEPTTNCLITLTLLAHPGWLKVAPHLIPNRFDVAYAFFQAIDGLDLTRAQLLVDVVLRQKDGLPILSSFDLINPDMQERITYHIGERYDKLCRWLTDYQNEKPVETDQFLSRLFGEVLSQPGFRFHSDFLLGEVTANLIESIQKFRWARIAAFFDPSIPLGVDYLEMVKDGVISSQYIRSWQTQDYDSVLLAPAYTLLMSNRPVDYQFWIDVGNRSWMERLYQPLTHPYVLSRDWQVGRPWTDEDEIAASLSSLERLTSGLLRRCRKKLFLGLSNLNEQGFEQRSVLLTAFQRVLRDSQA